jgi:hypothetical protein
MRKFRVWLEDRRSDEVRDAIISKIRVDMGVDDDDEIAQMKTADLSTDAKEQLLKIGPVMDMIGPARIDQIKDFMSRSNTTVGTLIDKINNTQIAPVPSTQMTPPETNPAMLPQQSQNLGTGI